MSKADRTTVLEETVAHQARAIEELSDELARQSRVVEQLRGRLETLVERFLSLEEQAREAPPVGKPPHY